MGCSWRVCGGNARREARRELGLVCIRKKIWFFFSFLKIKIIIKRKRQKINLKILMIKQFKTAYSLCFTCKNGKMCILYFVTSICSNNILIFSELSER